MKVIVKQDTMVWINGKPIEVKKGLQEVDDNVATILLESGNAEDSGNEKEAKKSK